MNDFLQSLRNGQSEKPRTPKTRKNYDNAYHYTSASRFQSYGGGYQNSRNQQMKRPPVAHPGNQGPVIDDATVTSMLAEAIEGLGRHIETLATNQDYLVTVQERTADMLERQAIAIEKIVEHLNIAPIPKTSSSKENESQKTFEHHYVTSSNQSVDPEPETAIVEPEPAIVVPEVAVAKPIETIKPAKDVIRRRRKIVAKKAVEAPSTGSKLLGRDVIMDIINSMRKEGSTYDQVAGHLIELGQPTFSGRGEWHAQTIHRLCSKK